MREIKFRAWNEVMEKMFTWNDFLNTNMKNTFIAPESTAMILMQFTGLHDKNEKEIYEGDIVKVEKVDLAQIIWDEDRMAWGIKPINDFYFDSPLLADNTDLELEVIGNIYETPELLKGADNIE